MKGWGQAEFTAVAGTRMHAAVLGASDASDVPDVVCIPGLGCSHRYFLPFARRLAPVARVAAVDLPGFGRSPGPPKPLDVRGLSRALGAWLQATGRAGALLVGNSAGCQVIVDLAAHSPQLLGPVVLNGPTVDRYARSPIRQLGALLADSRLERPTLLFVLIRDYLDCGPRRALATARHLFDDPIERKLHRVRVPAIVVRGSRDPIASRAWVDEVAALLPDGRVAEVLGAGHTLNYSAPDALAAITSSLLPTRPVPATSGR